DAGVGADAGAGDGADAPSARGGHGEPAGLDGDHRAAGAAGDQRGIRAAGDGAAARGDVDRLGRCAVCGGVRVAAGARAVLPAGAAASGGAGDALPVADAGAGGGAGHRVLGRPAGAGDVDRWGDGARRGAGDRGADAAEVAHAGQRCGARGGGGRRLRRGQQGARAPAVGPASGGEEGGRGGMEIAGGVAEVALRGGGIEYEVFAHTGDGARGQALEAAGGAGCSERGPEDRAPEFDEARTRGKRGQGARDHFPIREGFAAGQRVTTAVGGGAVHGGGGGGGEVFDVHRLAQAGGTSRQGEEAGAGGEAGDAGEVGVAAGAVEIGRASCRER